MWPQRQDRGGGVRRGLSDMREEEEFGRGLRDMSEEEEFDAASATCARRRSLTRPPRHERGGGVRCGLSDMREEEEFDAASAT